MALLWEITLLFFGSDIVFEPQDIHATENS